MRDRGIECLTVIVLGFMLFCSVLVVSGSGPPLPTAGWTLVSTQKLTARSYVRLSLGDATLYNGAAGPGDLKTWAQLPAPPVPPAAALPQINGYLNSRGEPIGRARDGTTLGAAKVGEEVRVLGFGFGVRPGRVRLGVIDQAVTTWGDTEIRFRVIDPGRSIPQSKFGPVEGIYITLPDNRSLACGAFLVEPAP